jgi:acetyltransferase-like isoleucine patch superfamily enzyme
MKNIRTALKSMLRIAGLLLALPYLAAYVCRLSAGSEAVSLIPGTMGVYTRQAFYRWTLRRVGADVHFGFLSLFSKGAAEIGDRVYIGRMCTIGWAVLGDDVMLADGVQVLSGGHQHGAAGPGQAMREAPQTFTQVTIGRGAWIGAGAIVMADVGEGAVVAAGAVVVEPVPAGAKVGGVPARALGRGERSSTMSG